MKYFYSDLWEYVLFPTICGLWGFFCLHYSNIFSPCLWWLSLTYAQISNQSPEGTPLQSSRCLSAQLSPPFLGYLDFCSVFPPLSEIIGSFWVSPPCDTVWKLPWKGKLEAFQDSLCLFPVSQVLWSYDASSLVSESLVSHVMSDSPVAYHEGVNPVLVTPYPLGGKVNKLF